MSEWMTKAAAAKHCAVTERTIERWEALGMPCRGSGRGKKYAARTLDRWKAIAERRRAIRPRDAKASPEFLAARARKEAAQADLAELQVGQLTGRLVTLDTHEARVAGMCDRVAAVLKGGLARYAGDVQNATDAHAATAVLDRIYEDVHHAIYANPEELEAEQAALVADGAEEKPR